MAGWIVMVHPTELRGMPAGSIDLWAAYAMEPAEAELRVRREAAADEATTVVAHARLSQAVLAAFDLEPGGCRSLPRST
ncbi:MAG: hypothetical protein IT563_05080 [Alphaproteobacteria bacterium]|nr:hypothetical protein [Alphaproteobacteria bacterium]